MYEARDMGLMVRMANFAVAESGRPVDWLHLAGPRARTMREHARVVREVRLGVLY